MWQVGGASVSELPLHTGVLVGVPGGELVDMADGGSVGGGTGELAGVVGGWGMMVCT